MSSSSEQIKLETMVDIVERCSILIERMDERLRRIEQRFVRQDIAKIADIANARVPSRLPQGRRDSPKRAAHP